MTIERHIVLQPSTPTSLRKTPMTIVTLSSRFQVVIPKDVREHLDLKPGQKLQALSYKGRVELIPIEAIEASRGFLRGIDTSVPRDQDRL